MQQKTLNDGSICESQIAVSGSKLPAIKFLGLLGLLWSNADSQRW